MNTGESWPTKMLRLIRTSEVMRVFRKGSFILCRRLPAKDVRIAKEAKAVRTVKRSSGSGFEGVMLTVPGEKRPRMFCTSVMNNLSGLTTPLELTLFSNRAKTYDA